MKMKCHRFNQRGIDTATDLLEELRSGRAKAIPPGILTGADLVEPVGGSLESPKAPFATRWELAIWLYKELHGAVPIREHLQDPGLWTWLAIYLFPTICPPGTQVREDARYVLALDDYRKRYRHLIAGPYLVFMAHEFEPHVLKALLATPPHAPGDIYEQFASRQELVTSSAVIGALTRMYYDESRKQLRRGAGTNARRLAEVLMQYDVNYDFGAMATDQLLGLLPREFERFMHAA